MVTNRHSAESGASFGAATVGNLSHPDQFVSRHVGPGPAEVETMLAALGAPTLESFIGEVVPESIRMRRSLNLPVPVGEAALLAELREIARRNKVFKSYLGMGYSDCFTPLVILRNVLENPGWYTAYTPYQAEIAQGRLEALLNYQTLISDLTGLEVANASLLDEGSAAAEAMAMLHRLKGKGVPDTFFIAHDCHPQTVDVVLTRAQPLGIDVVVGDPRQFDFSSQVFGCLLQYPGTDGGVEEYRDFCALAHEAGAKVAVAADLLSLTVLAPPGEWGADVCVGSAQRFGVPMGYGGPHAAFFATRTSFVRSMPGRIIGVSRDSQGQPALRMTLQTREQHIRREKATSNVCTAQVLLAVMAGMYAVYHGPDRLRAIAMRVHGLTQVLAKGVERMGFSLRHASWFDTLAVQIPGRAESILREGHEAGMNFRILDGDTVGIALDETTTLADVSEILQVLARFSAVGASVGEADESAADGSLTCSSSLQRRSPFLTHPVFNTHHSETEMLRYLKSLESKDLSLVHAMIPLGSCTMKLNATAEMIPVTWPEFGRLHPFAPREQGEGYSQIFRQLEEMLAEITGFAGISLQPNAGSQGEYAGMLVIRKYHQDRGEGHREICLIPSSAHGTNPASAVMAGYQVVVVRCDEMGNIDVADLREKVEKHAAYLGALMVTYPSTHGVFEEEIKEICAIVHGAGGQVYMDGANMNAQVGLCRPGDIGADVCHLNLHKTFCIPHGGGGPGMGPIGVAAHLQPYLPSHPVVTVGGRHGVGAISAAPWGSASILLISWVYIRLMGAEGLAHATAVAILNANYIASRLKEHYPVLYRGKKGRVAHECILDTRPLKISAGIEVDDIAKRLMDYGFHAPTMSFPVAGTLMVEPTESEPFGEIERFIEAMIGIRREIEAVEMGRQPREGNVLKHAPHTASSLLADAWDRPYSRQMAAHPTVSTRQWKFWPAVGRLDNVYGDRNLQCICPPMEDYESSEMGS